MGKDPPPPAFREALASFSSQDLPMSQALAAYAAELRRLNPTFASAYDNSSRDCSRSTSAPPRKSVKPCRISSCRTRTGFIRLDDFTRKAGRHQHQPRPLVSILPHRTVGPRNAIRAARRARAHFVSIMPERRSSRRSPSSAA